MANDLPVSDLMKEAKHGDQDAVAAIAAHFWTVAERIARRYVNEQLCRPESQSDIANAALRSALSFLGKPHSEMKDRDDFSRVLKSIIRKKADSARRCEDASKRRHEREQFIGEIAESKEPKAPDHAIGEELGERVRTLLMQEKDETRRLVGILGLLGGFGPAEIHTVLTERDPETKPPSRSAVRLWLNATKQRLADELREAYGNE